MTSKTPYRPTKLIGGRREGEDLEGALPAEAVVEGDTAVRIFGYPTPFLGKEGEHAPELREAGIPTGGLDVLKRAVGKVAAALEGGGGEAQTHQSRQQGFCQQDPEF